MIIKINGYMIHEITEDALSDMYNYPDLYMVCQHIDGEEVFYGLFPEDEANELVSDCFSGRDLIVIPKTPVSRWKAKYCI